MKNIHRFLLLAVFAGGTLLISSCDKEDDGLQLIAHDDSVFMRNMHEGMATMEAMMLTQDPDHDFSSMMIMHHEIAIKNSEEELRIGTSSEMKAMAQSIVDAQMAEIEEFNAFLAGHPAREPFVPEFTTLQMMNMMQMSKGVDLRPLTGNPDLDFAALMIDHHQAAIENSVALLTFGREEQTKEIARRIIADQKMEIRMLQDYLLANKSY
jgi:uncharacterized protein (DUF305 family)